MIAMEFLWVHNGVERCFVTSTRKKEKLLLPEQEPDEGDRKAKKQNKRKERKGKERKGKERKGKEKKRKGSSPGTRNTSIPINLLAPGRLVLPFPGAAVFFVARHGIPGVEEGE
jgi:hypothetical protein